MTSNTFEQKVKECLQTTFNETETNSIIPLISEYILTKNKREFNKNLKSFYSTATQKYAIKTLKNLLINNYTALSAWKCICYAKKYNLTLKESASKFSLLVEDLVFIQNSLKNKQNDYIEALVKADVFLEPLNKEDFNKIYKTLSNHCNKLIYKKLRFLTTYDLAINFEDLKQELDLHLIRSVRAYEHFKTAEGERDIKKITNYARIAISNYVTNLVLYFTKRDRSRIKNVTVSCGICPHCLAGDATNCSTIIQEYNTVISSLNSFEEISVNNLNGYEKEESIINSREFIKFMKQGLSPKLKIFIDTVTDESDNPEFEAWLRDKNLCYEKLSLQKLIKFAMLYLGLNEKEVNSQLGKKYNNYRKISS
jgi:hypothetical protein